MTEEEEKAYLEGYDAYPNKDCPYKKDSNLWEAWQNGHSQCGWDSSYYN